MNRTFTTEKGSVLPVLNLRGQDYLEVKYRLVWFREEHPDWSIETEFVTLTERAALARAILKDESGRVIATAHKAETSTGFPDFMEKAETGAIGRALALIGYGTQFCADELDEGDRIVDSPANPVVRLPETGGGSGLQSASASGGDRPRPARTAEPDPDSEDLGEYEITFGRKYLGKKLKDVPKRDIESYLSWLTKETLKKGGAPSFEVRALEKAVQWYHYPETRPQARTAEEHETQAAEALAEGPLFDSEAQDEEMPGLSTAGQRREEKADRSARRGKSAS